MLEHPCKYNIAKHFTLLSSAIIILFMSLSSAIIILFMSLSSAIIILPLIQALHVAFKNNYNIRECMLN
jgi:hypothetical protein